MHNIQQKLSGLTRSTENAITATLGARSEGGSPQSPSLPLHPEERLYCARGGHSIGQWRLRWGLTAQQSQQRACWGASPDWRRDGHGESPAESPPEVASIGIASLRQIRARSWQPECCPERSNEAPPGCGADPTVSAPKARPEVAGSD